MKDKWDYINEIKKLSNSYEDKLLDLMDYCNKSNLMTMTYEEAKEFYEKLVEIKEKNYV